MQDKLDKICESFPYSKSKEDTDKRKALWSKMDYNGNGYMNITEIENGWKYLGDLPPI